MASSKPIDRLNRTLASLRESYPALKIEDAVQNDGDNQLMVLVKVAPSARLTDRGIKNTTSYDTIYEPCTLWFHSNADGISKEAVVAKIKHFTRQEPQQTPQRRNWFSFVRRAQQVLTS